MIGAGESPIAIVAQAAVAVTLIAATMFLAYLDPEARSLVTGALVSAVAVVVGWFFGQRSNAAGGQTVLNGMSHMAAQIAAGTPGPTGPPGPAGQPGTTGAAPPVA